MGHEIITIEQMRAIDARSAELGVATRTLIENAGRSVADAICARMEPRKTAVLCGPGNNGGDGWAAARILQERGWPVSVETLVDRAALKGDAASAAADYLGHVGPAAQADLFVDAMFGAGLSRPLEGVAAQRAETLPAERVVAVDVPSGVNGDGLALAGPSASARLTVTFVRKKPAHVLARTRTRCGEVVVADIGAPAAVLAEQGVSLFENLPGLWALPWPSLESHKHARGQCMVVSGGVASTGAARLSARAALRAGAGLVTLLSPPDALIVNASAVTAIMVRKCDGAEAIANAAKAARAVVIGPAAGVHARTRESVERLLAQDAACVLDADALTVFQDDPEKLFAALRPGDVLTPHAGEFRRLFGDLLAQSPTRIHAARAAAKRAGCVVLLKGPDTVIAAPDGRCAVTTAGTPFLATAGSGDVLAGIIAGLIAQDMASWEATCAGAWLHARSGEVVGPGLVAEDLSEALPSVLNELAPDWLRRR